MVLKKAVAGRIGAGLAAGREIIVGVSGGSGAQLARRFVEVALGSGGLAKLHLVLSDPALDVARREMRASIASPQDWIATLGVANPQRARIVLHDNGNVGASIASGSYPASGMIVIPCSGGTLGSIAHGVGRDLLQRAADVCLKERRPLVLAFRESPYSLVHVENMRAATLAGAIIAPPTPAFYVDSPTVERMLDAYCLRAARLLGLKPRDEGFRWEGGDSGSGRRTQAQGQARPRRRPTR
ncbi:MAG: UbiX family flavin prenyltransferase [Thermoanaerobaculia bacterium]